MLKEQNGRLIDSATGKEVVLHGVNRCGLECWSKNDIILDVLQVALDDWHADTIRLPVSQDRWFGYDSAYTEAEYRTLVDRVIDFVAARKKYVILDCHSSDLGEWGKHMGGRRMADRNTVTFWRDAATHYKNHPYVLFNLYNEPQDISWDVWKNGGWLIEDGVSFYAVGTQQLVDTVRETGAKNLVVLGGIEWSGYVNGVSFGFDIDDRGGNGIMMDAHIYPWNSMDWDGDIGVAFPRHPVLIGEFGHQGVDMDLGPACMPRMEHEAFMPRLIDWIEKNGFCYCAWCFDHLAGPCLLRELKTFKPTRSHGVYVKEMLRRAWDRGEMADQILAEE